MAMRDLIPWSRSRMPSIRGEDAHPLWALNREMNRLFDEFWHDLDAPGFGLARLLDRPGMGRHFGWPHVELTETDKEIKLEADLPGMDEKDVELLFNDGILTIRGEKKGEMESNERHVSERYCGRFERQIALPSDIEQDKISADFDKGVLTVTIPKSPTAESKAKRISITTH